MTTQKLKIAGISLILFAFAGITSCEKDMENNNNEQYASVIEVTNDGATSFIETNVQCALVTDTSITEDEQAWLLKMKDEEKLAHDVYIALYDIWGSEIFSKIAKSENNHISAVQLLLSTYGISDFNNNEAGIFTNSETQTLYNNLVNKASVSLEEAYKTAILIEEMDIADLSNALAVVSNANIKMVFENLQKASRNHLRAFNRQLTNLGVSYEPVYLNKAEFDQIVSATMEKGKQYKMKKQKGAKGNGNGNKNGKGKGGNRQQNGDGSCTL